MVIGKTEMEFLGFKIQKGQVVLQKHVLSVFSHFPDQILDKTQLQLIHVHSKVTGVASQDLSNSEEPVHINLIDKVQDDIKLGNWSNMQVNLAKSVQG